jgi:fucose permease
MIVHLVADGLDKSNGALFLVPTICAGIIIPLVFAWTKRGHK